MADTKLHVIDPVSPEDTSVTQHTGLIVNMLDRHCQVAIGHECFPAKIAFSCLVKPLPGDVVLTAVSHDSVYITAILERRSTLTVLEVPGDLQVSAPHGSVHIATHQQLTLDGGNAIECSAKSTREYYSEQSITTGKMTINTNHLNMTTEHIALAAKVAVSTTTDLYVHAGQSVRTIENADITRAGTSLQEYESLLRMHAKTASITTDDDIKIDGRLIHMG